MRLTAQIPSVIFVLTAAFTRVAISMADDIKSAQEISELELAKSLRELRPLAQRNGGLPPTGLSLEEENRFLHGYAPVLKWDKTGDFGLIEALVTPSFFVESADDLYAMNTAIPGFRTVPPKDRPKWVVNWLKANPKPNGPLWIDSPGEFGGPTRNGPAGNKQDSVKVAIKEKLPCVFGLVQPLGDYWSLQYWVLLGYNNALNRMWHHEGDWLCIEIIVKKNQRPDGGLIAAFYHNHGLVIEAMPGALDFADGEHKKAIAFLEAGTNEPWPLPGDGGVNHADTPGLYRNDDLGFEGFGDELGIRPHNGTAAAHGYVLDCSTVCVNIRDESSIDATLVRTFPGHWGGTGSTGKDSPLSPMYNNKMRLREFGNWR